MVSPKPLFFPITSSHVKTKKDVVLANMRAAIIDGALAPGQRLVIDDLAASFGVSPIPVREAIQQLQAEGFVELHVHASAVVAPIHPQLIHEVFAILETCEWVSAKALIGQVTPEIDAQLTNFLGRLDQLSDNLDGWQAVNLEFHQYICTVAGMPLIRNSITRVLDHWNRMRRIYLRDIYTLRLRSAQTAHWEMYRAIKTGDIAALERATIGHLRTSREMYASELQRVLAGDPPAGQLVRKRDVGMAPTTL